jgi:hypothetical protein
MKQTATDWMFDQLWETPKDKLAWFKILMEAKEMEKEQIIEFANSFYHDCGMQYGGLEKSAQQYYNETYEKDA